MSKVVAIRDRLKREYEQKHGVRLTYLAFIARAVVDALGEWPRMNAEIRGDQIVDQAASSTSGSPSPSTTARA